MQQHTLTHAVKLAVVLMIGLTATIGCSGFEDPVDEGDSKHDSFMAADAKADVPNTIHENSPEARAILRVVNSMSRHKLISEADLYWRSAVNLINYREGVDGVLNTEDDRVIFTLAELDSIYYVGKTAFRRLRKYVNDNDLVVFDDVTISEEIPEVIDTEDHTIVRGEIAGREKIEIRMTGSLGDRVLMLLRKANSDRWNPRIAVLDAETRDEVISVNPWGTADARIPRLNDELGRGFELERDGTDYLIVLHNTNDVEGLFEFSLECVGGPCYPSEVDSVDRRPLDELYDNDLRSRIVLNHQSEHIRISYYDARMEMFSTLDNFGGEVECAYTGTIIETDTIPSNLEMNAEHTWPQSKGSFDGAARSDLHHIFPVTSMINSIRGAASYCNVEEVIREVKGSKLGYDGEGRRCFEPRDEHKGNAARAMLYFATVYQQTTDDHEEEVLRGWHEADPVDAAERIRAEKIQIFQGSPQPFVLQPDLVEHIADF